MVTLRADFPETKRPQHEDGCGHGQEKRLEASLLRRGDSSVSYAGITRIRFKG
jgi:hypothetical protein